MKYFHELTIDEMFEHRDWWSGRSDDHRAYKNGMRQEKIIEEKIEELGGWTKEMVESWNKYAPSERFIV